MNFNVVWILVTNWESQWDKCQNFHIEMLKEGNMQKNKNDNFYMSFFINMYIIHNIFLYCMSIENVYWIFRK